MKAISYIFAIAVGVIIGRMLFYSKITEKVEYVKGETITDTIRVSSEPIKVEIPAKPILEYKDTIIYIENEKIVLQKVDTAQIIANYIKKNTYRNNLFNNDNGELVVDVSVQYNKLTDLSYSFTPIHKVITKERKRTFSPFVGMSYNTFNEVALSGGMFYHNLGVELQYIRSKHHTGYGAGLKIKF